MLDIVSYGDLDDQVLALRMIGLRRAIDMLELQFSELAAQMAKSEHWKRQGSNSAVDWIRFECKLTQKEASARVRVGELMPEMASTVRAMEEGEIGFPHVSVMARTAEAVGELFDEQHLLAMAKENSPGKFYYKTLHHRHAIDARAYARDQEHLAEERALHLNQCEDGCLLTRGVLDPVAGAEFRSALEPLARPAGKDDHRTRPQRLADALVEAVTHGGKQKIAMHVTASIETLLDAVGAPGAENEFSIPISSKTVERWACDCSLSRILLQDSVVIDAGRSERTIKGPRRQALNARDRHCRWPGCDRPASWCDGHHIRHWIQGGGDELENLMLLCSRHHRLVHEGRRQIVRTAEGRVLPIAPWTQFGAAARGPD